MQSQPLRYGVNYVPSTAVNSTEMWAAETFDPDTIRRELGWAQEIGLNALRIFVQSLVWETDRDGLLERLETFLSIADGHGFATMLTLLDECAFAGKEPYSGAQDEPIPGVHNSQWTASPGVSRALDKAFRPQLEAYIRDIVGHFANDARILAWDVYNEPGNEGLGDRSLPLLSEAFGWVRSVSPVQPLTSGVWRDGDDITGINQFLLTESDILTFHFYGKPAETAAQIERYKAYGYPLLLTEWMSRPFGSSFANHLPILEAARVGSFFWGLVNGRTQTHFPWGSEPGAAEPSLWFHDLLRRDGTPYDSAEISLIHEYTARGTNLPIPDTRSPNTKNMTSTPIAQLLSLQVGKAQIVTLETGDWRSAIHKKPVSGRLSLGTEGLTGDQQANRKYHGGPDKAVCCFCAEHYADLRKFVGAGDEFGWGAFGENFTVEGMTESEVCLGDSYGVGSAIVQVSQPRQPCVNLVHKWGNPELPLQMTTQNQTGYYLRVLQTGEISAGETLELRERPYPDLTIAVLNDAKYRKIGGIELFRRLSTIPELEKSWREGFAKRKGVQE